MIFDMLTKLLVLAKTVPPLIHANRLTTWPRLLYMLMGGCVDGSLPLLVVALLALLGLPHLAFCALRGNGFGGVDATAHGHAEQEQSSTTSAQCGSATGAPFRAAGALWQ